MKSFMAKAEDVKRKWYVVDAEGKTLGRLASQIASVLRGKHKPIFTPHVDTGDFVIVLNAGKVVLTGKKLDQKLYRRHSQYPGGLKEVPYRRLMEKNPERIILEAVRGMLPHNSLGRKMLKRLKVYAGDVHNHEAQQPEALKLDI